MKIGIVGSEEAKFTESSKQKAKECIRSILIRPDVTEVVSGRCHLGGIDVWAEEIGHEMGLIVTTFAPVVLSWESGYKPRNLKIANYSDEVHCITVDKLPSNFTGMKFSSCYHCHSTEHVKSGGCWTMKKSKHGVLHVIRQEGE